MSLIQHVHPLEGIDREEALVDLFLPPLERTSSINDLHDHTPQRLSFDSQFPGSQKSLRRVVSYDALKPPEETLPEEYGGLTPYRVSTAKRVGKLFRIRHYQ
jgi:hypothetical protein